MRVGDQRRAAIGYEASTLRTISSDTDQSFAASAGSSASNRGLATLESEKYSPETAATPGLTAT